jgi:hypothetical protein
MLFPEAGLGWQENHFPEKFKSGLARRHVKTILIAWVNVKFGECRQSPSGRFESLAWI